MISYHAPHKAKNSENYLSKVLDSSHLSGNGGFTKKCHIQLKQLTGTHKVLLTHSCTAALEMAFILAKLESGDEVIMPSYAFASLANAVLLRGAVPIFVDINAQDFNIDYNKIEDAITERTKAIAVVHYAGVASDMLAIKSIADTNGLFLIEDAAQCIGAKLKNKHLGTFGNFGTLSFHETKNIHCGHGGALLIRDDTYDMIADVIWEKGTNRKAFLSGQVDKYTWQAMGSSFLPSELNAALLLAQLEELQEVTDQRRLLWQTYSEKLQKLEHFGDLALPQVPNNCFHNAHIFYVRTKNQDLRDGLIAFLKLHNISATFHYLPLHSSPNGLRACRSNNPMTNTDRLASTIVRLPLHTQLTVNDQQEIISKVFSFFGRNF